MEKSSIILLVGIACAAGLAFAYSESTSSKAKEPAPAQEDPAEDTNEELPPNHPAVGANNGMGASTGMAGMNAHDDEPPSLAWKAPAAWSEQPNPNPMRLATYKISDDAELVVSRAGGDVATNVARWAGQFEGSPTAKQVERTVHDMKITEVQIDGAYTNTMDPNGGAHAGWSMLAAIVAAKGRPYFFKIVGPATTVHAAKKPFDAMLDSLTSK